ncbi:MAG: hypothetical protein QOC97_1067 [Chloroflexota bacterium]|nr:hypothetical protein [Chloroflexota bacterium]
MHERTNPGPPPERPPVPAVADLSGSSGPLPPGGPFDDPRALQILSTEHWSLLAGRSLSYNEAFTRAGMFLTALSASMVAIAFVAQADQSGDAVRVFALVLLGFDLFVGLTTYLRLVETTREDLRSVQGMNRIRHAYLEMAPGLAPYFVSSDRDDLAGILMTYEGPSREDMMAGRVPLEGFVHGLSTNTGMVAVVVSLVGASLAGVAAAQVGASMAGIVAVGTIIFVLLLAALSRLAVASISRFSDATVAHFPSDPDASVAGAERPQG